MPWPCGSTQADCVLCSSSALGSAIVQCRAHWYRIPRERIRPFRSVRACWRPCHHQSCGWGKPRPMRSAHTPRVARCPEGPHWTPTSSRTARHREVEGARSARTMPAVREAALPTAAPHQLWLRMGQAGARPVAVLATVARWPNGSRFGPYGQKEGFLTRIWSLATCAHESAEGHRLGGVRQRWAPWL